ncbi:MAG: hypothetical protein II056_02715, partial [Paludibacteraceae bacterium]|nr:hypothetical protein [Paludibacteraceae bacterium]
SQKALNATMLANPYVLAAVALGGLVTVLLASIDTTKEAEIANERYNETVRKNSDEVEKDKKHIDDLLSTLSDETEAQSKRTAAYNELISKYGIDESRISMTGKGKLENPPRADLKNRRCDFYFYY